MIKWTVSSQLMHLSKLRKKKVKLFEWTNSIFNDIILALGNKVIDFPAFPETKQVID